jgi:hypothetical protein
MAIKYVHGQVLTFSLRALYRFGSAVAGVAAGEPASKVADHLEVMKRHIEFVQECVDDPEFAETEPGDPL